MPTLKAVVTAPVGLHARPAAVFVRAATETGLPVTIRKAGAELVDATSLLHVMTADFPLGCEVELSISDAALDGTHGHRKAEDALDSLRRLLESRGAS